MSGAYTMVNFEYYKIFYYACKYKNFTKAANVLQTSQSAISHTIKNLELELGCRLFVRSNRGIELTPEGKNLYTYVSIGCEQFRKGEAALSNSIKLERGIVYIATTETALHCYLLAALKEFHDLYPNVRYKLMNCNTVDAITATKDGTTDFAIVPSPFKLNKLLKKADLLTFQDILICGEHYAHLKDANIYLRDISQYPFICLSTGTAARLFFDDLFQKNGTELSVDIEPATSDMILPMVQSNFGIGFIPEPLARIAIQQNTVYEISVQEKIAPRTISIIYDTEYPQSLAAKEFLNFLTTKI